MILSGFGGSVEDLVGFVVVFSSVGFLIVSELSCGRWLGWFGEVGPAANENHSQSLYVGINNPKHRHCPIDFSYRHPQSHSK